MDLDPLDSPDFDPIAYINQKFPTESSLEDLDSFSSFISSQISLQDVELSRAIQTQSVAGKQGTQDIIDAQGAIVELFDKISDIKQQASQSEKMVQEICADIKRLDCAKTHLQSTITSLKRLQMLMAAMTQLEDLVHDAQYRDIANLLDAVKQLMTHFQTYTSIPIVIQLQNRLQTVQNQLRKMIHQLFQDIGQMVEGVADSDSVSEGPSNTKTLADSCLVIDTIGLDARSDLLEELIRLQLNPYDKLFGPNRNHNGLSNTDRRWAWFKRLYRHIDGKFSSIFPVYWNVQYRIALDFLKRTKVHLISALNAHASDEEDVQTLIQSLQSSLRFENDLSNKFEELLKAQPQCGASNDLNSSVTTAANEGKKSGRKVHRTSIVDFAVQTNSPATTVDYKCCDVPIDVSVIVGSVSSCFENFLGPYVAVERQNLEEMLRKLSSEEDSAGENELSKGGEDSAPVLGSAMSMFAFIKGSIKRCTALANGQTFFTLCKEFKTCLQQYAEMLINRCPVATVVSAGVHIYRLSPEMEVTLSHLINTGEYCAEVIPQLENLIKSKMVQEFQDKLDFNPEVDVFLDMVAHVMKALVSGLMDKFEPAFREMAGKNWGTMTEAGEDSSYLHSVSKILQDVIPKIRKNLSSSYYRNVCSKLATEFCQRYLDAITKQKKLSDAGTQQLLLDTHIVKTMLVRLPNIGGDEDSMAPAMYTKLITSRITQIEGILKLVATPEDMLAERFPILWPSGTGADLQLVMNLKGITKRQDQQRILDSVTGVSLTLGAEGSGSAGNALSPSISALSNSFSAATASSASMVSSSMKFLSQDLGITSSARNAVGNLKWTSN